MTPIKKERLAFNIVNSPKRASVVTNWLIGGLAAILALVTPEQRDAMLAALPIPAVWLPLVAAGVIYLTQVWPQFNLPMPPKPSDEAVAQTIAEAVSPNETVEERRAREDKELAERRAREDAEIAAAEAAAPLTEFAIAGPDVDDDTILEAIKQLAPNISSRNLEKIRFRAEQLRQEKIKSQPAILSAKT